MSDALQRYKRLQDFFSKLNEKGELLFPESTKLDLQHKEESYINQMALGGIVALLSYRQEQNQFIHPFNAEGEFEPKSPYLRDFTKMGFYSLLHDLYNHDKKTDRFAYEEIWSRDGYYIHCYTPHYKIKWRELCEYTRFETDEDIKFVLNSDYIEKFGKWVLEGKLPFDHIILKEAFKDVSKELDELAELTNQNSDYAKYYKIKSIFLKAMDECDRNKKNDAQKFHSQLNMFKNQILRYYSLNTCLIIAESVLKVSQKIGEGNVQQKDVDTFILSIKEYKKFSYVAEYTILKVFFSVFLLGVISSLFSFTLFMLLGPTVFKLSVSLLIMYALPSFLFPMILSLPIGILGVLACALWGKTPIDHIEAHLFKISKNDHCEAGENFKPILREVKI